MVLGTWKFLRSFLREVSWGHGRYQWLGNSFVLMLEESLTLRSGHARSLLSQYRLRFLISFRTNEHHHQSDLLYVLLHVFVWGIHDSLSLSQAETGPALFTPQTDAPRPASVSATKSTILLCKMRLMGRSDYVNNNPAAFSNAYFEFNALNIYQ